MNTKRCLLSFLAVWLFIFLFEWVFHGILLQDLYAQAVGLLRPPAEMQRRFHFLVLGHGVMALGVVWLVARLGAGSKAVEGAKVGLCVAVIGIGINLVTYAVQPFSSKLVAIWCVGAFIEFGVAGLIAAAIYRPVPGTVVASPLATAGS